MAAVTGRMAHASGIPLGGIGTGSVEIRPDGYFHEWQIFNLGQWAPQQPECCRTAGPNLGPDALAFHVRTQQGRRPPIMRRLGTRSDQHNLYSFTWLKSVREIEFQGRYPVADLTYHDDDLPVAVSARMFSPFIPHDSRTSGTPGFYAVFRVKNTTADPVEVSLLGMLQNPLAWGAEDRRLTNRIARQDGTTYLAMRTAARLGCEATLGSLCLAVTGGEASWIAGEFDGYFHGHLVWGGPYSLAHEAAIREFREAGRLPSLLGSRSPAELLRLTEAEIDALPVAARKRLVAEVCRYPFARCVRDRILEVDRKAMTGSEALATFLKAIRIRLDALAGGDRKAQRWGAGALASRLVLAPQEEREVVFTLAWHFPNHFSAKGPRLGHMYENWFKDAEAVGRFLVANRAAHRAKACAFADALYDTTLDPVLADAWAGQLTTLPKCTWWTRSGDFAVWEGLGCCGFHTTDITYQGSFNILALFPDLQKRQMTMGARFQRADGRVHHFFTPDLSAVDNGFDRVDMNPQFVLLAARDYLWTGDRAYLKRLWPHIVRAMANTAELDADGDGLPDHDTRRNTYDAWNFFGTPSYIASLWLGALLAASRLADDLGQRRLAARWRRTLKKGAAAFDRKLWNGEYFSLWVDGKVRDECCMTDQIDGEWFTHLVGLGHVLPRERIRAALEAVMRYNFRPEDGLINASYPPGRARRLSTYNNFQALAPWTGIEYAIASMMLDFGLVGQGCAVVRHIHERYLRAGRFWNHVECGDHYYRAMSSWAILLAATGFKVDVPRGRVTLAPAIAAERVRAPWVSSSGWGTFEQTAGRFALACASGRLALRELRLRMPCSAKPATQGEAEPEAKGFVASLGGRRLPATISRDGDLLVVRFRRSVAVAAGRTLALAQPRT